MSSSRCLIDTTLNQVPSLNAQLKNYACKYKHAQVLQMENSETKLYSHLHLPRHNPPKSLIEFCPYWVQSYAFFQIQYLLVMNFLSRILSIDEQSFFDLPSSPMPLSIQENGSNPVNRMSFVLS